MRASLVLQFTLAMSLVACRASVSTDPRAPLDSIVVRVVDGTTHAPVAGATVSYVSREALEPEGVERVRAVWDDANMGRSAVERQVTTDEHGEARLEAPLEARSYRKALAAQPAVEDPDPDEDPEAWMRYELRAFGIEASSGDRFATLPIDRELAAVETLELHPAEFLEVQVVDGAKRPVGGFPVHVRAWEKSWTGGTMSILDDAGRVIDTTTTRDEDEDPYEVWLGETDAHTGIARIGPLDRIRARGRAGSKLEATLFVYGDSDGELRQPLSVVNGERIVMVVPQHSSLDVEVVDPAGRAVEGVELEVDVDSGRVMSNSWTEFTTVTLPGRGRIVGIVPSSKCQLTAKAPGFQTGKLDCRAPETNGETQHVRIQLEKLEGGRP